jgi:hypothetical protein
MGARCEESSSFCQSSHQQQHACQWRALVHGSKIMVRRVLTRPLLMLCNERIESRKWRRRASRSVQRSVRRVKIEANWLRKRRRREDRTKEGNTPTKRNQWVTVWPMRCIWHITYWFSKPIPRCRRLMHVKPISFSSLSREQRGLAELLTVRAYALDILYHA